MNGNAAVALAPITLSSNDIKLDPTTSWKHSVTESWISWAVACAIAH